MKVISTGQPSKSQEQHPALKTTPCKALPVAPLAYTQVCRRFLISVHDSAKNVLPEIEAGQD